MAGKGGCVDGLPDAALYSSPIPFIGLYIAVATVVCLFCMTFDLVHGLFGRKKPFVTCKLFVMNAFTMTMLAIATKIPNDLITPMPRVEDQFSKLSGAALLCTSIGFYMPSLGSMGTSERYGNLAALSVMGITMIVNVCIQIRTGVIFSFTTEHIILMVCISILLLLMWSSVIALRGQIELQGHLSREDLQESRKKAKDLDGLRGLIRRVYACIYRADGQTLLCKSPNHYTFGLPCVISLVVVLQSMLRSFALKSIKTCSNTASDYKWSILIVIVAQSLTIIMGSFSVIYRWLSRLRLPISLVMVCNSQLELEYLKLKTFPRRFLHKKLYNVLAVAKDFLMDVLIPTQIILTYCNIIFVGLPIFLVKRLLACIIYPAWPTEPLINTYRDLTDSLTSIMFIKETKSYEGSCESDRPSNLIALISESCPPGISSECASFIGKLEATGEVYWKSYRDISMVNDKYRVSCLSVLVLSGILAELMPSSPRKESLIQSLKESFEIVYFVDQKTHTPNFCNERRWTSTKEVWAHWEDPSHWFRTKMIISCGDEGFNLKPVDDLEVLKETLNPIERFVKGNAPELDYLSSLTDIHKALVLTEFSIICQFVNDQKHESVEDLLHFLESCFVKVLSFTLFDLSLAILKEIDGDDPIEIGEGRVRNALRFYYKLKFLSEGVNWWPVKFGHIDASFATATDTCAADDDGTIRETGFNDENVAGAPSG